MIYIIASIIASIIIILIILIIIFYKNKNITKISDTSVEIKKPFINKIDNDTNTAIQLIVDYIAPNTTFETRQEGDILYVKLISSPANEGFDANANINSIIFENLTKKQVDKLVELELDINKLYTTTESSSSTSTSTTSEPSTTSAPSTTSTTSAPSTTSTTSAPSTSTTSAPSTTSTTSEPSTSTIIQLNTNIAFLNTNYYLIKKDEYYISNIYKLNDSYYVLLNNKYIYKYTPSASASPLSLSFNSSLWNQIPINNNTFSYFLLANNTLFAIGQSGCFSSSDGNTWNVIKAGTESNNNDLGIINNSSVDICNDETSYYLLINNSIYKKPFDYKYWSKIYPPIQPTSIFFNHISIGNNIIVVSSNRSIFYYTPTNQSSIVSFTYSNYSHLFQLGDRNPKNIKKFIFANNLFIGISNDKINNSTGITNQSGEIAMIPLGGIIYSSDGNIWTEVEGSGNILYDCIIYDNNKIIAFGQDYYSNKYKVSIGTIDTLNNTISCTHYDYDKNITDIVIK